MKITFLGTGTSQGVPVIACRCQVCNSADFRDKRLRSSILIEKGTTAVVIDSGPDFRQQMLRAEVNHIDGLLFTHEHKDHIAGMDDIRAYNYVHREKVNIYANLQVQEALHREFPYVFADFKYPGVPEINMHTIDESAFSIGEIEFLPVPVLHYRLPVLGFRIGDFTYITDANHITEQSMSLIRGSKIIVINALRREPHVSHFTLDEALEVIGKLGPEKAYLTHISHQLGMHEDVNAELPAHVQCAYDGLVIEI
ncbi:MAG: MBL fold metallo-hydrolase [Bacteroidia bacterium]|nr:MBL fold metallo-hydrolase [Bacteroidota bacterium]MBP9081900.1 MBL fold metallo-hydrolase [Bacteroidia bacterium]MBK7969731.1 MBL fold metallo-hydrolase [Bacteroidota bacterium]MBK8417225.1 MBL fold metallo-hydrolase [Bacteroidota bacterium]MBK8874881.1 MBL fold metallo-hydrolase [Bacteroidota bacterium]